MNITKETVISEMIKTVHNPRYSHRISTVSTDAVILPRSEWRKIKREAVHLTAADEIENARKQDEEKRQEIQCAETKRARLLEFETKKQLQTRKSATEAEMQAREYNLLLAEAKANEELDEVKAMNSEVMAARVRALRDRQVESKRERLAMEKELDRKQNEMMEEGRLRAIEIYNMRETALREQRVAGREVLLAQIEERKQQALIEKEKREKEKQEMMRASQMIKEEDERLEAERKRRQREFLNDCLLANEASLKRKQRDREREIEEVQAMVEYQRQQAEKDAERERELIALKAKKELDCAAVRKQQQRAIDTRAEEDEIRARRIQEEQDRRERQKELEIMQKKQRTLEELRRDRETAIALKQKRLLEMAKIEKAEFDRVVQAQNEAREKARQEYEARQQASLKYRDELQEDLVRREENRRIEPLRRLDESRHLQEMSEDYLERLERIRQAKVEQLKAEGVPEKYLADLRGRRFLVK